MPRVELPGGGGTGGGGGTLHRTALVGPVAVTNTSYQTVDLALADIEVAARSLIEIWCKFEQEGPGTAFVHCALQRDGVTLTGPAGTPISEEATNLGAVGYQTTFLLPHYPNINQTAGVYFESQNASLVD